MLIKENVKLSDFTSFRIGGPADFFVQVDNVSELRNALTFANNKNLNVFILGGGSNIFVSDKGYSGLVIQINIKGIEIVQEDNDFVYLKVGAGENWDDFVLWAVEHKLWGIENLSHIPGSVGATPVQNVGAYGVEVSHVIESVEVYNKQAGEIRVLSNEQCEFSYRKSIFNSSQKGRFIVLSVLFKLSKKGKPVLKYADIIDYFEKTNVENPALKNMRDAVICIRDKKLPFPTKMGSAGSFFKNSIVSESDFHDVFNMVEKHFGYNKATELLTFKDKFTKNKHIKIPTAFLIELCGLKGKTVGGAQISENHALVILNKSGNATASDVLTLVEYVKQEVKDKIGIDIYPEPEFIGF